MNTFVVFQGMALGTFLAVIVVVLASWVIFGADAVDFDDEGPDAAGNSAIVLVVVGAIFYGACSVWVLLGYLVKKGAARVALLTVGGLATLFSVLVMVLAFVDALGSGAAVGTALAGVLATWGVLRHFVEGDVTAPIESPQDAMRNELDGTPTRHPLGPVIGEARDQPHS